MSRPEERRDLGSALAGRLRELRARRDMTQEHVARALGCHESAISRWESGVRMPSCADVLALARLYRVSCDDLLGNTGQPVRAGVALLDEELLERLRQAADVEEFDAIVAERGDQAAWLPVPEGAVVVAVDDAMRRARQVADRFPDSAHADRLFRPGV